MGYKVPCNEPRRTIVMESGQRLDLHNVTGFDCSGTFLRLWSDEGFTMVNGSKIDWIIVKTETRPGDEETR